MTATDRIHRTIDAVWRIESARLIAGLTRIVRDVGVAEELAQDALVAALEQWPEDGVPDNPGAWLMATAKHRALDLFRRREMLERKHQEIGRELEAQQENAVPDLDAALDDPVGDDLLRLVFIACHPVLSPEARVALTLRLLGGLTTDEIARAFLVPEPTIAQRIVRAKKTLTEKKVPLVCQPIDHSRRVKHEGRDFSLATSAKNRARSHRCAAPSPAAPPAASRTPRPKSSGRELPHFCHSYGGVRYQGRNNGCYELIRM